MKKLFNVFAAVGGSITAVILIYLLIYALSWIVTCGIVKLITLCFGWTFSWAIATGVWVAALFLKWIFGRR